MDGGTTRAAQPSTIKAVRQPKIYAYTTPAYAAREWVGGRAGQGLIKIGRTDRDAHERIGEQLASVKMPDAAAYTLLFCEPAQTDDGKRSFSDRALHDKLRAAGVTQVAGEWYEATLDEVEQAYHAVCADKPMGSVRARASFAPRPEQAEAVARTAAYFRAQAGAERAPEFLWNAKMRFGKTFAAYQLAREMGWTRILVLTYKPAVSTAWRDDLEGHVDFAGWRFAQRGGEPQDLDDPSPLVWFASFQDLGGTDAEGRHKARNLRLADIDWDAVYIDEYHFGAWRQAARDLYGADSGDTNEKNALETGDLDEDFRAGLARLALRSGAYLYLSGTPFRALTQGDFLEDQIFNWTYSDEQRAKATWAGPGENPYRALPEMMLLTYEMPEGLAEVARNAQAYFSLSEFFRTEENLFGEQRFVHEREVQKWLDLLRGQGFGEQWPEATNPERPPLPFEDTRLLTALQHSLWYLPTVAACEAMAELLGRQHNVFWRGYDVLVVAGTGAGIGPRALPPVERAIGRIPQDTKTITLTCGKLLTGVTVPAWGAILMLRELSSPESYFQAAFRVQSPWTSTEIDSVAGGERLYVHKEQCFVIDFAPNRALRLLAEYGGRLRSDYALAADQSDEDAIGELLDYLPVLCFDGGAMHELEPADVIDYLTRGLSASMLARRWNSQELLTFDLTAMKKVLANGDLLASLEGVPAFRTIRDEIEAVIARTEGLAEKAATGAKLSKAEQAEKKERDRLRFDLREKLRHFVVRIPAFMYLTDNREKTIREIIEQDETDLFRTVTSLTLDDFDQLVAADVFDRGKMNDAVWKFRQFEAPSLSYDADHEREATLGGWDRRRDERLAALIDAEWLKPGDVLTGLGPAGEVHATVSTDYGLLVGGVRYVTPTEAALAAGAPAGTDGWLFWQPNGRGLQELEG